MSKINLILPPGVNYFTNVWTLDPGDDWTISELLSEIESELYGVIDDSSYKLVKNGVDLISTDKMHDILSEGDTIELVEL